MFFFIAFCAFALQAALFFCFADRTFSLSSAVTGRNNTGQLSGFRRRHAHDCVGSPVSFLFIGIAGLISGQSHQAGNRKYALICHFYAIQ
jgi:hypothetical protein